MNIWRIDWIHNRHAHWNPFKDTLPIDYYTIIINIIIVIRRYLSYITHKGGPIRESEGYRHHPSCKFVYRGAVAVVVVVVADDAVRNLSNRRIVAGDDGMLQKRF